MDAKIFIPEGEQLGAVVVREMVQEGFLLHTDAVVARLCQLQIKLPLSLEAYTFAELWRRDAKRLLLAELTPLFKNAPKTADDIAEHLPVISAKVKELLPADLERYNHHIAFAVVCLLQFYLNWSGDESLATHQLASSGLRMASCIAGMIKNPHKREFEEPQVQETDEETESVDSEDCFESSHPVSALKRNWALVMPDEEVEFNLGTQEHQVLLRQFLFMPENDAAESFYRKHKRLYGTEAAISMAWKRIACWRGAQKQTFLAVVAAGCAEHKGKLLTEKMILACKDSLCDALAMVLPCPITMYHVAYIMAFAEVHFCDQTENGNKLGAAMTSAVRKYTGLLFDEPILAEIPQTVNADPEPMKRRVGRPGKHKKRGTIQKVSADQGGQEQLETIPQTVAGDLGETVNPNLEDPECFFQYLQECNVQLPPFLLDTFKKHWITAFVYASSDEKTLEGLGFPYGIRLKLKGLGFDCKQKNE